MFSKKKSVCKELDFTRVDERLKKLTATDGSKEFYFILLEKNKEIPRLCLVNCAQKAMTPVKCFKNRISK